MGFTGFHWVFIGFYLVSLDFTGFYWVLLGFSGFYWVLLGFSAFYWVLLVYLVLLGFSGFYWVLLGFSWFYWVYLIKPMKGLKGVRVLKALRLVLQRVTPALTGFLRGFSLSITGFFLEFTG